MNEDYRVQMLDEHILYIENMQRGVYEMRERLNTEPFSYPNTVMASGSAIFDGVLADLLNSYTDVRQRLLDHAKPSVVDIMHEELTKSTGGVEEAVRDT